MPDVLSAALAYVEHGIYVFPVVDKRPPPGFRWRDDSTTDPAVLDGWFGEHGTHRGAGLAVDCGRSGLVVVDLDVKGGVDGVAAWRGLADGAPATFAARTASGGLHLYFLADPNRPVRNTASTIAPGVDVRGDGGYVVAAPTAGYHWTEGVPDWTGLPVVPHVVPERASRPDGAVPDGPADPFDPPGRPFTLDQARAWVAPALDRLRTAPDGEINTRLNEAACALSHFEREFWTAADAERELYDALAATVYDGATWQAGPTIRSGLAAPGWRAALVDDAPETTFGPVGEPAAGGDSWAPLDLGPYLRGEITPPEPTLGLARDDGLRLIYPGLEHSVAGETESGKSWLCVAAAVAEITDGRSVVYIHFEEADPADTIGRLRALGLADHKIADRFHFVAPEHGVDPAALAALVELGPSLVILDGVNEGMALHGAEILEVDGTAAFRRRLVKPLTRAGIATLQADHVVKNRDNRGRGPLGSIHKINGLTGVQIVTESAEAFGRDRRGAAHVFVTKDRPGHLRRHGQPTKEPGKTYMGTLVVDDTREHVNYLDLALLGPRGDGTAERDTEADAGRVLAVLAEQDGGAVGSERQLSAAVRAAGVQVGNGRFRELLDDLVYARRVEIVDGPRGAKGYRAAATAPQD